MNTTAEVVQPTRADRWLFAAFLVFLLWLPLPAGGHLPWAEALDGMVVALLLASWGALHAIGKLSWPRRMNRFAVPLVLWGFWLAWTAIQGLPLSAGWLDWLSPAAAAVHHSVAGLDGVAPYNSISIAPGESWNQWALSWLYAGVYLLTLLLVRSDKRLRAVLLTLLISGFAQAVYGSIMTLSGLEYGFLQKKVAYLGSATGSFINRNHYAAYLGMCAAAGIGLVLADLRPLGGWRWRALLDGLLEMMLSTRLRVRLALLVIAVGLVLTRSRMGNLAFFASLSFCGLGYVVLRERHLFLRALLLFSSILLVDVLVVSQWFGLERMIARVEATRLEQEGRVQLLEEIGPVISAYDSAGSGLGSFTYAYEPHRSEAMRVYMNHAHNDYVEFLVETGIPGLGLLLLLAGVHVVHAVRVMFRRQHRLKLGACFAVIMASLALAIHATAEFNFQIPANAATYVVLLGIAASCSSRNRRRRSAPSSAGDGAIPQGA